MGPSRGRIPKNFTIIDPNIIFQLNKPVLLGLILSETIFFIDLYDVQQQSYLSTFRTVDVEGLRLRLWDLVASVGWSCGLCGSTSLHDVTNANWLVGAKKITYVFLLHEWMSG